jgi:hypothetical protein
MVYRDCRPHGAVLRSAYVTAGAGLFFGVISQIR